jgi:hypothetical protein
MRRSICRKRRPLQGRAFFAARTGGRLAGARLSPVLFATTLCAIGLGGCGLGAGAVPNAVQLTVTHRGPLKLAGQETVLSLLMRNYGVTTADAGGFVKSIDGVSDRGGSQPLDWFYYVNGVQPSVGAATNANPGDHIWWDLHDWSQTEEVSAVVGSFPEPFLNGIEGKRYPVRIECTEVGRYACDTVAVELHRLGVSAAVAPFESRNGEPGTLSLLVGPWSRIASRLGAQGIQRGPRASGVYALFSSNGMTLTPLDAEGRHMPALGADTGLIAATRNGKQSPTWVVTGTDRGGVALAAKDFDTATLRDHFAVALTARRDLPLPEASP